MTQPSSSARTRLIVTRMLLGAALGLLVMAIAGYFYFVRAMPARVRESIADVSKREGVELSYEDLETESLLPWQSGEPRVRLLRATVVHPALGHAVTADSIEVPLSGSLWSMAPTKVRLRGVFLDVKTLKELVALDRAAQSGALGTLPLELNDVDVKLSKISNRVPIGGRIAIEQASLQEGVLSLGAMTASMELPFLKTSLGPTRMELERPGGGYVVTLPALLKEATVAIDKGAGSLSLKLGPTSSQDLGKILGVSLQPMTISAEVSLPIEGEGPIAFTFSATLKGFIPPHPPELNGIVFGKQTSISGKGRLDGLSLRLEDLAVTAGALNLKGQGTVTVSLLGKAHASLTLRGTIPCSDLASSAATARLGREAGMLAGMLSRGRLGGTVGVRLGIEADLDDLNRAKITPNATIGCRVTL